MYLITGGGSGIGQALAWSLADRGLPVMIVGRRKHLLQETANYSPLIQYFNADVSKSSDLEAIAHQLQHLESISALINNAGTLEPIATLKELTLNQWQNFFHTNLDPAFLLPKLLEPQLAEGRVLNILTGLVHFPVKHMAAYCASKSALSMLTRCYQLESETTAFASVIPGIIDTYMQQLLRDNKDMDAKDVNFYNTLKEQGRLVSATMVAQFLTWLLLDVDKKTYASKEWDIYDTSHHQAWLKPPNQILHWDF